MGLQHIGRQAQTYIKLLAGAYGAVPTLASSNAIRLRPGLVLTDNPYNREYSEEHKAGAGHFSRRDRKHTAGFSGLSVDFRPSGTLNTLPESSALIEAALGGKTNITLATTVNAGTGTTTGATLASVTGLVAHKTGVLITCPDGIKRIRTITNIASNVVTWAPALAAAPADGAAVKATISYQLTTANAPAFDIARYVRKTSQASGHKELLLGASVGQMTIALDAKDPIFSFSGMGQRMLPPTDGSFPAQPAGFTQVGGDPPHGMVGELWIDASVQKFLKMSIELTTGMRLRNEEADQALASEAYRGDRYGVSLGLDMRMSSEEAAALFDKTMAGTYVSVLRQQGFTEGNCFAVHLPKAEFVPPDSDMNMNEANWPYKGVACESVEDSDNGLLLHVA